MWPFDEIESAYERVKHFVFGVPAHVRHRRGRIAQPPVQEVREVVYEQPFYEGVLSPLGTRAFYEDLLSPLGSIRLPASLWVDEEPRRERAPEVRHEPRRGYAHAKRHEAHREPHGATHHRHAHVHGDLAGVIIHEGDMGQSAILKKT